MNLNITGLYKSRGTVNTLKPNYPIIPDGVQNEDSVDFGRGGPAHGHNLTRNLGDNMEVASMGASEEEREYDFNRLMEQRVIQGKEGNHMMMDPFLANSPAHGMGGPVAAHQVHAHGKKSTRASPAKTTNPAGFEVRANSPLVQ